MKSAHHLIILANKYFVGTFQFSWESTAQTPEVHRYQSFQRLLLQREEIKRELVFQHYYKLNLCESFLSHD